MSNYGNTISMHKVVISTRSQESTAKGFEELMEFDLDFSENQEYFRSDTLKKGFRSEAHRIAVEKTKKPVKDNSDLEDRVNSILGKIFDSNHYGDWEYVIVPMVDDEYTIVVSYIG